MEVKQVDKELLEGFALWQKNTYDMHRDNVNSKQEMENLQKAMDKRIEEVAKYEKCLQESRESVTRLQKILSVRCDMEEENRRLRKEVSDYNIRFLEKEESHRMEIESIQKEMEDMKLKFNEQLQKSREEVLNKAEEDKECLRKKIREQATELETKEESNHQKDMEHHAEIMRVRFEYDTKMLKLQKQKTRSQQTTQPGSSNQDIFRKKLQHARAEADKELSTLRRRISQLEAQLKTFTEKQMSHQQHGPPPGLNSKRMRRF